MKNDFTCGEIEKCDPTKTKPYPFCGSKEIVIDKYEHRVGERFRIFCTGCMAMIDPGYAQNKYTVIEIGIKERLNEFVS